jgi:RNA polymerase sigma-70 factor (ECF subfamily)
MQQTGAEPSATMVTDQALVARARNGDLAAFEAIAADRLPALYRFARAILGSDGAAADATTTTLVAAWRELPLLDDPARFDGWLERILVSECRMDVERAVQPTSANVGDAMPGASDELDREAILTMLGEAFESLDAVDRAVVVLHDLEGRTPAAIGGSLHMPVGTVRWRLHEAHERFRGALEAPP